MVLNWPIFSLMILIHVLIYAGVYCYVLGKLYYCDFQKRVNSTHVNGYYKVCFSLPLIITTATANKPCKTETYKMD